MPATGLPDVKQKAIFDASEYVRGADETVLAALEMAKANKEASKSFDEVHDLAIKAAAALAGTDASFRTFIRVNEDLTNLSLSVKGITNEIRLMANGYEFLKAASERTAESQRDAARIATASINIQRVALAETTAEQARLAQQIEQTGQAAERAFSSGMRSAKVNLEGVNKELRTAEEAIQRLATAGPVADVLRTASVSSRSAAAESEAQSAFLRAARSIMDRPPLIQEMRQAARDAISATRTEPGATQDSFPNITAATQILEESRRYRSVVPTLLEGGAAAAVIGIISNPGVVAAAGRGLRDAAVGGAAAMGAGAAWAGHHVADAGRVIGGIGGNIAAGLGGLAGGAFGALQASGQAGSFAMGRAATDSLAAGRFIARWYPAVHWAMMLSNELLATAGPALVAGGMGALVGVQGFEQLIPRGKAVFNTSESLGDSLGKTTGQAWGLHSAVLQNAQDLATGSAAQLAGAAVNIINAGAGGPFVQLGLNTTSMIDRFAATLTQDFTKGGLGNKLGNIVTGGSGYLQQFGDVLANLGKTFVNLAPNLPGVGGDLLSTLSGGTGALARATGWMGGMMGPVLATEAGARWGPALLGGAARGLGRIPGGVFGSVARTATAADAAAMSGVAAGDTIAGTGIAGALGGLGAWQIGGIAAGALLVNKGYTYQTPESLVGNQMQTQVGQLGIPAGIPQIIANMRQLARYPASQGGVGMDAYGNIEGGLANAGSGIGNLNPGQIWGGIVRATHGALQLSKTISGANAGGVASWGGPNGMFDPSGYEAAQAAIDGLSKSFVYSLGTGSQVQQKWKALSGNSIDMGKAFDVATMAQLQLGSSFEKNGKLTSQAKQMIGNLYAGYAPMQMNTGMFGAAVGAQTAMAGLQHTQVAAVNSSYDQLMQLVTGGAAGSSGFFSTLGGAQVTAKHGGIQFQAPPAFKAFANALTSFTSAAGAGAWNVLTNSQNGLIPQLGNQTDWLRSMQTMGALSPGQTTQMAAFQMQQLLPMARKSPAALAMLSTIGQEFGGPVMTGNQAQDFKNIAAWTDKFAANAKTYNQNMNAGTVAASSIPRDAQQFVQQVGSGIAGSLATGLAAHGATLQDAFMNSIHGSGKGAGFGLSQLEAYGKFLAGAGVPKSAAIDMARYAAQLAGAGPGIQSMISRQLGGLYAKLTVQANTAPAKAALASIKSIGAVSVKVTASGVATAKEQIRGINGKTVTISARASGVGAAQQAINSVHGKVVDLVIRTIISGGGVTQPAMQAAGYAPGVSAAQILGGIQKNLARGQTGMLVPGYGGGDIFPAMLEPGELVVPKHMVGSVAPILSGKIPGFQSGGGIGVMGFETMLQQAFHGEAVASTVSQLIDRLLGAEIPKFPRSVTMTINNNQGGSGSQGHDPTRNGSPTPQQVAAAAAAAASAVAQAAANAAKGPAGTQFGVEVIKGLAEGIKNAKGASKSAATAMMNHISQEIQYAKSTAQNLTQGLNFGGMNVDPATGGGPVQTQMQSYADSLKAFSGDIKSMSKAGLNKDLMQQMIAAGPVQGDALAKSIQQGPGGVKAVNQLYASIQKMSKGIAAQGASAIYGGHLNQDLKSGTFINNNVSIHISMSGGGGDLSTLSTKELNQLVAKIQAALLKQAKRNRKTGVALKGKQA